MKPYLLVVLATLLWATNIALGRSLHDLIGPFTLSAARFTVAGLVFLIFMLRAHMKSENTQNSLLVPSSSTIPRQNALLLTVGMGFTGVFAFTTVLYLALHWTTASNASLINAVGPLITMIMASLFLSEALSSRSITGAVISLAGVVLIITQASFQNLLSLQFNLGDLLALAAVFLWSVYSLLARRATRTLSAFTVT
ncbi:MAG: EamA family transporter, partial [Chloroflexi bacterium]